MENLETTTAENLAPGEILSDKAIEIGDIIEAFGDILVWLINKIKEFFANL